MDAFQATPLATIFAQMGIPLPPVVPSAVAPLAYETALQLRTVAAARAPLAAAACGLECWGPPLLGSLLVFGLVAAAAAACALRRRWHAEAMHLNGSGAACGVACARSGKRRGTGRNVERRSDCLLCGSTYSHPRSPRHRKASPAQLEAQPLALTADSGDAEEESSTRLHP